MLSSAPRRNPSLLFRHLLTFAGLLALTGEVACVAEALPEEDHTLAADEVAAQSAALSHGGTAYILANGYDGISRDCADYSVPGPCQFTWYNTHGGVAYERVSRGIYKVTFRGLGQVGGNAQVVAADPFGNHCKVTSWYPVGGDQVVNVRCHNEHGGQENAGFAARYVTADGGNDGEGAYVWAGSPWSTSYIANATYSWNSTGGTNRIERISAGKYVVTLPGHTSTGGSVEVTAYGTDGAYCKVQGWVSGSAGTKVTVLCFDLLNPVDSKFSLNYLAPKQVGAYDYGAYAWANDATASSYTPNATYSYNSGACTGPGSSNSVERSSEGEYSVRHSNLDRMASTAHVTAYGSEPNFCNLAGISPFDYADPGAGTRVGVRCFTGQGYRTDTRFVETFSSGKHRKLCWDFPGGLNLGSN